MKGSPLVRALVLLGVLLLLSWPLSVLTRRSDEKAADAAAEVAQVPVVSRIPLVLTFSQAAARVEVSHLGKVVWSLEHPGRRAEAALEVPFPKEGIELSVAVQWEGQGDGEGALRLQLTGPDGTEYDRSVWGGKTTEAVVAFP